MWHQIFCNKFSLCALTWGLSSDVLYHLSVGLFSMGPGLVWSGPAWLWQASCLHSFTSPSLSGQPSSGETGLSEGEWQAKPVLTQHLKPPHKYRLPFPISKRPIHLCLHAYTLLHVMLWGVSLKMTMGHLADSRRVGLWCAVLQFSSTSASQILHASQRRLRSMKWAF